MDRVPRIVKATRHERRTPEHIGAEIRFVETVPASTGAFHVCAFEKAAGAIPSRDERTDEHWVRWGALVGQLHRLSTNYPGPPPPLNRPTWEEEYKSIGTLPMGPSGLRRVFDRTVDAIRALPRDAGAFGAIHTDLHSHNIFGTGASRASSTSTTRWTSGSSRTSPSSSTTP